MDVSIIVPVYDVAPYLARCLDSLLAKQADTAYEVLAIDNGSTDGSAAILKEYASRYPNLRVLSSPNGVSAARNVGLETAVGEFITFVDSDDWVDEGYLKKVLSVARSTESDVVFFNYRTVSDCDGARDYCWICDNQTYDLVDDETRSAVLSAYGLRTLVCDGVFRSTLLKDIRFESLPNGEDTLFSYTVLCRARRVAFLKDVFYNYYQRVKSASNQLTAKRELSVLKMIRACAAVTKRAAVGPLAQRLMFRRLRSWLVCSENLAVAKFQGMDRAELRLAWGAAINSVSSQNGLLTKGIRIVLSPAFFWGSVAFALLRKRTRSFLGRSS